MKGSRQIFCHNASERHNHFSAKSGIEYLKILSYANNFDSISLIFNFSLMCGHSLKSKFTIIASKTFKTTCLNISNEIKGL